MVGALTQHAKSQSAATFCSGAMLNYTTIDPYNASLCSRTEKTNTLVIIYTYDRAKVVEHDSDSDILDTYPCMECGQTFEEN